MAITDNSGMSVVSYCTESSIISLFQTVVTESRKNNRNAAAVFINGALVAAVNVQGVANHSPLHWGIKQ